MKKMKQNSGKWCKPVSVLLTAVMLCGIAGCSKNEGEISQTESSLGDSQGVSADDSVLDDDSSEQSEDSAEFDFDEAVKNITLFGHKILLPCTIADFGEDFSLMAENLSSFGDITSCGILYKGKSIGTVSFVGYKDGDYLNDKQIISLSLGFIEKDNYANGSIKEALYEKYGWYSGLIEVDFFGLSFESTEAEVKSLFGEPNNSGDDSVDYKFYSDDQSKSVEVSFYQNKVKQITIYV